MRSCVTWEEEGGVWSGRSSVNASSNRTKPTGDASDQNVLHANSVEILSSVKCTDIFRPKDPLLGQ